MRCLRCGKPMSSFDNSCPHCHHYYVNKVGKKGDSKEENKTFKEKAKHFLIVFSLMILFGLVLPGIGQIIITNLTENNEYTRAEKEKCLIICENNLKEIKNNYCICSNGTRRNLNENSTSE